MPQAIHAGSVILAAGLVLGVSAGHARICDDAAAGAAGSVPAALLNAVERVESAGNPWSVNVDGTGRGFATKQEAIDYTRFALASGARFVDVGCFQIDLHYHPDAFDDLASAFDPAANAAYAARLLVALRGMDADWNDAIAAYHSADPRRGEPYRARVLGYAQGPDPRLGRPMHYAGVWVVEPGGSAGGPGLPHVYTP